MDIIASLGNGGYSWLYSASYGLKSFYQYTICVTFLGNLKTGSMTKIKTCSFCGSTVSKLWYSSPPCCANYACKSRYNESKSKKGISSPKKKNKPLNRISDKELQRLAKYRPLRDKFLEGKTCQFTGCNSQNVTLHHARGRIGKNLTDVSTFRALCPYHHKWAEEHPEEAKEMNLSINRL